MSEIELVLGLMAVVAALAAVARRIGVPYPLLMVVGGTAIGLVPGLPHVELEPDLVFLLFLPPLLYIAAASTSIRDIRRNTRPIALLAVGLVLFTIAAVAVAVRLAVPSMSWPIAFALGAIVAPPDAIAATAVLQRVGAPKRIVTILEGESLLNDATALVAYRIALLAAVTGSFSLVEAGGRFLTVGLGGVLLGLAVGFAVTELRRRLSDTPVSITVSLLAPYVAYLPAEQLGVSGVLAAVTAGLYVGQHASRTLSSEARVAGAAVWQMVVFVLNGLVFTLVGLQLPAVVAGLGDIPASSLLGLGALVSLTVIVARFVWVFPGTYLPRLLSPSLRRRDPNPPWQWVVVLGWAGMRGAVSLAAALALPHDLAERPLLIFITYCVIATTLVGQGLTLPFVIRGLGVTVADDTGHEEAHARAETADAALARLAELRAPYSDHGELLDALEARYSHQATHALEHHDGPDAAPEEELIVHRRIRRELIEAEREAALDLHARGAISDEVRRRIERDLDLEELRAEG
ncbi:MAG TPA: Na+/H+ antiporter [Candidatus Limnocylindria bacterium]|nr:Na+/H+ antiporter [Candidatus Limnocylindria bacterium]